MALALEGQTHQALLNLAPEEEQDLGALITALERQFGWRSSETFEKEKLNSCYRLDTFDTDIQLHVRWGYPHFSVVAQEELEEEP